jgi:rfaE bifunctional protein nucleotidyltransferase chain/domain
MTEDNNKIVNLTNEEKQIITNNYYKKNEKHNFFDFNNLVCVKPWGHEFLIYQNQKIGIWFLKLKNGHKTSLHCHFNKDTFIIVLKGSVKVDLINNQILNLNCMDSIFLPHYNFHGLGSFSEESYIIEIEIYNNSINFTDKNDLLRINDQYHRPDNNYQTSINTIKENLEDYNYFKLDEQFCSTICDVDFDVIKITSNNLNNYNNNKNSNYNILLNGVIYQHGKYIKEGSIIKNFDDIQMIEDEITILTLEKFDYQDDKKIIHNLEQLKIIIQDLKKTNKQLVLSSGCFDILHVGHIKNLIEAKKMGDILMVCLSNDEQIKKLKGDTRPVNNYEDRINIFKTIKYVDYVILYNETNIDTEETLGEIMKIVDPNIWAKGSDYKVDEIFKKHPYLKKIKLIDNIENKSTTKIIQKIENINK